MTEEHRYINELMMTGALHGALAMSGAAIKVEVVPDADGIATPSLWVRVDFLRSRYRITVTMDPDEEETHEDADR